MASTRSSIGLVVQRWSADDGSYSTACLIARERDQEPTRTPQSVRSPSAARPLGPQATALLVVAG